MVLPDLSTLIPEAADKMPDIPLTMSLTVAGA